MNSAPASPSFPLGSFALAQDAPPFVIAEVGVNHNGSVDLAHEMIEVASRAGAQAVKFQIFDSMRLAHSDAPTADYQQQSSGRSSQKDLLQGLELPVDSWTSLRNHADDAGLLFLATAFDPASFEILLSLDPPALKIPSGDLTNRRAISQAAATGLPLIVSTGMATEEEVARAVYEIRAAGSPLALLHCVTSYPAPPEACNLRVIATMRERHHVVTGWSDHTTGPGAAAIARVCGALIFERHFTMNRLMPGPDHRASDEPDELADYIARLHAVDLMLGSGVKSPSDEELQISKVVRRGHYATRDLSPGELLAESDSELLRPEQGFDSWSRLEGWRVVRPVQAGTPIMVDDVAPQPSG